MRRCAWLSGAALLVAWIAAVRLHTAGEPLERDITTYAVIGRELLAGRALYSDLWDHKPPAVHLGFAAIQWALGDDDRAVLALGLLCAVVTGLGVFAAARRLAGPGAGAWAAVLWTLLSGDLALAANQPNTEALMNALVVWAVALWAWPRAGPAPGTAVMGAGVLWAWASLHKHVIAVPAAAIALARVAAPPPGTTRRRALAEAAAVAIIGAVAWGATAGFFWATGRLGDFQLAVIDYNRQYAGPAGAILGAFLHVPGGHHPVLPLLVAVAAFAAGAAHRSGGTTLLAWLAGTHVAVALPGQMLPHYDQLWLPPVAVGVGLGASRLARVARRSSRRSAAVAAAGCLALLALYEASALRLPATEWSRLKYGDVFVEARALAGKIESLLGPGETFYEFGAETGLYLWARRSPPSGVFYALPLVREPTAGPLTARVLSDLERRPPDLFVWARPWWNREDHPVVRWALERYEPLVVSTPWWRLYARRDSPLAERSSRRAR